MAHATHRHRIRHSGPARQQQGIALIVALVFVMTLSLVVAVGMRHVFIGERAVAHERDRSLAFQAAESAGREAIALLTTGPMPSTYPPFPRGANADFWRTTSSLLPATDCAAADTARRFNWDGVGCATPAAFNYENSKAPQYVVEKMPAVENGTVWECWYRVTSRATGGSNEADVILQIMTFVTAPTGASCP